MHPRSVSRLRLARKASCERLAQPFGGGKKADRAADSSLRLRTFSPGSETRVGSGWKYSSLFPMGSGQTSDGLLGLLSNRVPWSYPLRTKFSGTHRYIRRVH